MPDVRGLFYAVCLEVTGGLGLQVTAVRLAEHPSPVDGHGPAGDYIAYSVGVVT